MPVDVEWDGVSLAKGAAVREEDGGWFVELDQPMPVGTGLVLTGDVKAAVTVARVHEGIGSGMVVRKGDARSTAAPPVESEAELTGGGGGEKKEKRKKRR